MIRKCFLFSLAFIAFMGCGPTQETPPSTPPAAPVTDSVPSPNPIPKPGPTPEPPCPVPAVSVASRASADADDVAMSAARQPGESWKEALGEQFARLPRYRSAPLAATTTVVDLAKSFRADFDVTALPEWEESIQSLLTHLKVARDERVYDDPEHDDFLRRALWLYPYNGCFTRAAHVAQSMQRQHLRRPGKIFAFGDLELKTQYDPKGKVLWSYHVVPAYRIGDRAVIYDGAIESSRLMSLEEWVARIAPDPSAVKLSVCDTYAYFPRHQCFGGGATQERSLVNHVLSYLPDEWDRLKQVGFAPEEVLGNNPPWLAVENPPPAPSPSPTPSATAPTGCP